MIKELEEIEYLNTLSDYQITITPFTKVIGYCLDEIIVGFLDYSLIYNKIEINYIFVKEEYRNKKIAFSLVKYIIENNEFENITLEVNKNNFYAIKLYESLGFKVIGIRENYYNGTDAYLMEVKS